MEQSNLEAVLPDLLVKTLEKGLRALVRVSDAMQLNALDLWLWTWRDEAFLPHGLAHEAQANRQPILLTYEDNNANDAEFLFLVEGARLPQSRQFQRIMTLFDGKDPKALEQARDMWRQGREEGLKTLYWRQTDLTWVKQQ